MDLALITWLQYCSRMASVSGLNQSAGSASTVCLHINASSSPMRLGGEGLATPIPSITFRDCLPLPCRTLMLILVSLVPALREVVGKLRPLAGVSKRGHLGCRAPVAGVWSLLEVLSRRPP